MIDTYYEVRVNNLDTYNILSSSRETAIMLIRGYYSEDVDIVARAIKPTDYDLTLINNALISDFRKIRGIFSGNKTYQDFIKLYLDFNGYDFKIGASEGVSFCVTFCNFTFRIVLRNGFCSLDDSEIIFKCLPIEKTFVLRNNCSVIYVGRD